MTLPYKVWSGLKSHPLGAQALAFREAYGKPCRLSPLIAMSDPVRTPDVLSWAESLPEGCAVIYRFDNFDEGVAKSLRALTAAKNQQLLLRQNNFAVEADGLHFKRHTNLGLIEKKRAKNPNLLITLAAIKEGTYKHPLPLLDGLLVSAVFPSQSPSAGSPIGIDALAAKVKSYPAPVFALGGVNLSTTPRLLGTGIAGISVVGALNKIEP